MSVTLAKMEKPNAFLIVLDALPRKLHTFADNVAQTNSFRTP